MLLFVKFIFWRFVYAKFVDAELPQNVTETWQSIDWHVYTH